MEKQTKEEKQKAKQEKREAKKEKKKKKIKLPISPERLAIIMAIIALIAFVYKLTIGVMGMSMVLIVAAIPSFFIFLCKALYAKNMNQTRKEKKKTYFFMLIFTASFALVFILFSVLKVGGIDITKQNTFDGWVGLVFIFFIIAMFVLSIINLKGALNKTDLVVIGIKEISFVSALADAVMINEFLYRVIISVVLDYVPIPFYDYINRFFPLGVGILMAIVPIVMINRWRKYEI